MRDEKQRIWSGYSLVCGKETQSCSDSYQLTHQVDASPIPNFLDHVGGLHKNIKTRESGFGSAQPSTVEG
ncbi:MAG: hypothetical protein HC780_18410 [Leptolyngbyaceae cyanobacterium CSU_1_3]|nr:hypothetical protein [Leptolyngbyaceae cyanobacterium CSU_1_3]